MPTQLPLKCTCGAVRGVATDLSPATGNRLVCLCDDCQDYAHHLEREEAILDADGGTDVFQMTPAQLEITHGAEHLRCLRLSPKGLLRWYTGCCNTPVGNTLASPRVPFVGVPHLFMDHAASGLSRDQALGPVRAKIQARFSPRAVPADAHRRAPPSLIARSAWQLLRGWLAGRQRPSPFFDARTGAPTVEPTVLTPGQRERLRQRHPRPS